MNNLNITFTDIADIEFDGFTTDAPDFSDAFIQAAWNKKEGRPCTEEELDYIQANYSVEVDSLLRDTLN